MKITISLLFLKNNVTLERTGHFYAKTDFFVYVNISQNFAAQFKRLLREQYLHTSISKTVSGFIDFYFCSKVILIFILSNEKN